MLGVHQSSILRNVPLRPETLTVDRALESRNENLLFFFGFLLYLYLSIVMKDVTRIETNLRY